MSVVPDASATPFGSVLQAVDRLAPGLTDPWEATAIIESLGYTDARVEREFGFPHARALADQVCLALPAAAQLLPDAPRKISRTRSAINEIRLFCEKFGSSFAFAIPWIAALWLDRFGSELLKLPADLANLLSLALMASLITSGGFAQVIVRRGQFYISLREYCLARQVCWLFVRIGCAVTLVAAVIGLIVAFYAGAFPSTYVLVGFFYYLLMTPLWLLCAALVVERRYIAMLLSVATPTLVYAAAAPMLHVGPAAGQLLSAAAGLIAAVVSLQARGLLRRASGERSGGDMLPPVSVLLLICAPYFLYGMGYFTFLFADRFSAGAAIPFMSGMYFGVDPAYKNVMDAALLTFLAGAGVVEYLNYKFMTFWYAEIRARSAHEFTALTAVLRRRHNVYAGLVVLVCVAVGIGSYVLLVSDGRGSGDVRLAVAGNLGYLLLNLALFYSLVLFSLRRAREVVTGLWPALAVNLAAGFLLSRMLDPRFATVGLACGAVLFALRVRRAAIAAMARPDYAYYAS